MIRFLYILDDDYKEASKKSSSFFIKKLPTPIANHEQNDYPLGIIQSYIIAAETVIMHRENQYPLP